MATQQNSIKSMAISVTAIAYALVFIYQAAFGYWEAQISRGLYVMFALVLTFLLNPKRKIATSAVVQTIDLLLVAASIAVVVIYIQRFNVYALSAGLPLGTFDLMVGIATILLVLEACRRTVGWSLTIIASFFLVYDYAGRWIPGVFSHRGYSVNRIVSLMYASTDGIYGSVAYTFSTFIFLFIIFGVFLKNSGAGEFFIDLAKAAVGRFTGGAAQAAVVSSWILGSIMGSSTANTAITGSVTIPLMKSRGYKPHVAAAVEAVVSIGGQFMPPIMGAGAFLMAAFLGVPYLEVVKAGLIPALLFFVSMMAMVYLEAKRMNIPGIPKSELPSVWSVFKRGWYFLVPIAIIVALLVGGYSPSLAGFWAIISALAASFLRKENRMSVRDVANTLAESSKTSLVMATTAGAVGIIIAAIALPGLGLKFSSIVLSLAAGRLPIALALVMVASFFLGMGMNVTSAYLLLVVLSAPALAQMGVEMIAAHFFIFWTSQLAVITPPVCLSAYVAAAIADADPWKTGWYSLRMGLAIYYIPILFVFFPALLGVGAPATIAWTAVTAFVGILSFAAVTQGYFLATTNIVERALLGFGAFALMIPGVYSDMIGFAVLVGVALIQILRTRRHAAGAA